MSNGDQFRELIEAYALGALDPEERAALESHLAEGCAECSKALDEARWLVSQLAYLAPDRKPSDMLRSRLMRSVRTLASSARTASPPASVPFWMWGAIAALLLFTAYTSWETYQLKKAIDAANEQAKIAIARRYELEEEFAGVIRTDPRSVKIPMTTGDKSVPNLEAMWHAKLGIVVAGQNVPMPSGERTLQLWLIPKTPGGTPIPSRAVRPDADGKFMLLVADPPGSMDATKALAITEEPVGGSAQPTTKPIWVGAIG